MLVSLSTELRTNKDIYLEGFQGTKRHYILKERDVYNVYVYACVLSDGHGAA